MRAVSEGHGAARVENGGRSFLADAAVIACPDCDAFGEVPPDAAAELDTVAESRQCRAVVVALEKAVEIREDFALKNPRGGGLDGAEVVVGRWVADQADVPFQRDVEGQAMGKQQVNRGLGSLVELFGTAGCEQEDFEADGGDVAILILFPEVDLQVIGDRAESTGAQGACFKRWAVGEKAELDAIGEPVPEQNFRVVCRRRSPTRSGEKGGRGLDIEPALGKGVGAIREVCDIGPRLADVGALTRLGVGVVVVLSLRGIIEQLADREAEERPWPASGSGVSVAESGPDARNWRGSFSASMSSSSGEGGGSGGSGASFESSGERAGSGRDWQPTQRAARLTKTTETPRNRN